MTVRLEAPRCLRDRANCSSVMEIRDTRYAKTPDGVYIAYQTAGKGPIDLAWQFDFMGDVDLIWEDPQLGP